MDPWIIIALLGAVIFLFAYIRTKGQKANIAESSTLEEMEEAFEHFVLEIKEDNRKLIDHVANFKASYDQQNQLLSERLDSQIRQLTEQIAQLEQRLQLLESSYVEQDSKEAPALVNDSIRQRYHSIFDLYQQGKSIEYIAKKMGMNKGEVQLILTLAQQEEAIRAEG